MHDYTKIKNALIRAVLAGVPATFTADECRVIMDAIEAAEDKPQRMKYELQNHDDPNTRKA